MLYQRFQDLGTENLTFEEFVSKLQGLTSTDLDALLRRLAPEAGALTGSPGFNVQTT